MREVGQMYTIAPASRKPLIGLSFGLILMLIGLMFFVDPAPEHRTPVCDGQSMNPRDRCELINGATRQVHDSDGYREMEEQDYRDQLMWHRGLLALLLVSLPVVAVSGPLFVRRERRARRRRAGLKRTLAEAQRHGDMEVIATTAGELGWHYDELSDPCLATEYTALSVACHNELGVRVGEGLDRLARQRRTLGDDRFRQCLLEVLDRPGADSLIQVLD